jgi:hypothetical protein
MKNLLFIVVNAATKTKKSFIKEIEGPNGVAGIGAVVDTLPARLRPVCARRCREWLSESGIPLHRFRPV